MKILKFQMLIIFSQITRLEGEVIKNEEEILSLKQSLVEKKDTITAKEAEIVQIKTDMNHQAEQHKAFVQVILNSFAIST